MQLNLFANARARRGTIVARNVFGQNLFNICWTKEYAQFDILCKFYKFQEKYSAEIRYCYMWPIIVIQPACVELHGNGQSLLNNVWPRHMCILNVPFKKISIANTHLYNKMMTSNNWICRVLILINKLFLIKSTLPSTK